ncbi:MAG: hypothetical protein K0B37_10400 [Bacteroidales bacterium]|nr:hypothetical protein [Bacteroidales bacterium]
MRTCIQRILCLLLPLALFSGYGTPVNSMDDPTATRVQGAGCGAIGGAALGTAIAVATGNNDKILAYAAGGAAVGATAGLVLGDYVAKRKQNYAKEEDRLDGEIKYATKQNGLLRGHNEEIVQRITLLQNKVAQLHSKNSSTRNQARISSQERTQYLQQIDKDAANMTQLRKELAALKEYQVSLKPDSNKGQQVAQLEKEINGLNNNIVMLDSNNKQMAQLIGSLPTSH